MLPSHVGFHITPFSATIAGFSSQRVQVKFEPLYEGQHSILLKISAGSVCAHISLHAVAAPIPITVLNPVVNLGCCYLGHSYRAYVTIANVSNVAMKAALAPPKQLAPFIEVSPAFGFCQARS